MAARRYQEEGYGRDPRDTRGVRDARDMRDPRDQIIDTRDARDRRIDPRGDPRIDPRADPRIDPRADPRVDPRVDPRMDGRMDPRMDTAMDVRMDSRMDGRMEMDVRGRMDRMDRMDTRDPRLDPRTTMNSADRGIYVRDERDDYSTARRAPVDFEDNSRTERSRYQDYFLPGEDINREVITYDICRYLGNDATVRPYNHPDGRQGYIIKAYRALTTAMITSLKQDSKRFETEQAQRRRHTGQIGTFAQSATLDTREKTGRSDAGYTGYQTGYMDIDDDDFVREPPRGYRESDMGRQQPMARHAQPPVTGYQQESFPAYQVQSNSGFYDSRDPNSSQPRTVSGNTPPPLGRGGQPGFPGGYPVVTSAPTQNSGLTYRDPTTGRTMVYQGPPGRFPDAGRR